jgi:adenylate cyclase class 2
MQTEIEAKFIHINPDQLRQKLRQLGAVLVNPERLMRRRNFDLAPSHPQYHKGWIRVRDEGDKITLTYKQLNDRTLHGTKEINLVVSDFDSACALLEATGLTPTSYQETKRESWTLGGVEVEIDQWPWIDPFVELEGHSEDDLKSAASQLDLDWSDALHGSVEIAYQDEYDVTEEEIDAWEEILFTPVPEWLVPKRRKGARIEQ